MWYTYISKMSEFKYLEQTVHRNKTMASRKTSQITVETVETTPQGWSEIEGDNPEDTFNDEFDDETLEDDQDQLSLTPTERFGVCPECERSHWRIERMEACLNAIQLALDNVTENKDDFENPFRLAIRVRRDRMRGYLELVEAEYLSPAV
jgi:hypothetical protein